jgi:hypothetical protein
MALPMCKKLIGADNGFGGDIFRLNALGFHF